MLYCRGLDFSFFDGKRCSPTDSDIFSRIFPFFTNFLQKFVIFVVRVTDLSLTLRFSSNPCAHHKMTNFWRNSWKIGEIREKTVKSVGAPFSVKNGEILVPDNPTRSKLVFSKVGVHKKNLVSNSNWIIQWHLYIIHIT